MKTITYLPFLFCISILYLGTGCEDGPSGPTLTEGKAHFIRSFTDPALNQVDTLVLRSDERRVVRKEQIDVRVSDMSVSGSRISGSGLLPYEAYVSAAFFRDPGLFSTYANAGGGDIDWLLAHLDRMAIVTEANYIQHSEDYDYEPEDSTLSIAPADNPQSELHPVYDETGTAYLARLEREDDFIPWSHPDVDPDNLDPSCFLSNDPDIRCIDVQSLTRLLYNSLTNAVSSSLSGMSLPMGATAVPGGPDGDGAFKLRFVPQTQYKTGTDAGDRIVREGVAFIFEGTIQINAPIIPLGVAEVKIYVPVFVFFLRQSNDRIFTIDLQPFEDIASGTSPPTGIDKLVVLSQTALGAFSQTVADSARVNILTGLAALPATDTLFARTIFGANAGLELGFNKYIDREKEVADFLRYEVIALPTQCVNRPDFPLCFEYNGVISTQVQPEDGEHTPVHIFILEK